MKLRAAVGVGVLLMCLAAITCTRQTPGNPSPNQAQPNNAENTPPKPTPAPAAAEGTIKVHGDSYAISTEQYVLQQKGKGGRTTKMGVGGGAAGAVIGGIAGGGKGAAIGGLVGGAAGITGSAMTGNKELAIPAESVLQFKLAQPLRLSSHPAPNPANESEQ